MNNSVNSESKEIDHVEWSCNVIPGEKLSEEKGKFRLQNRWIMLTYPKIHVDKEKFKVWLEDKSKKWGISQVEIAHETGDKQCLYNHSHVVIEFKNKCETTSCRYFDLILDDKEGVSTRYHPHFRKLPGKKAFKDCLNYISKEDPSCIHLRNKKSWVLGVSNCESDMEALQKFATKPGDVTGILAVRNLDKMPQLYHDKELEFDKQPWQLEFRVLLESNLSFRRIVWLYDPVGHIGKSQFCAWVTNDNPKKYWSSPEMGRKADASTIILNAMLDGWNQDKDGTVGRATIIADLSRGTVDHVAFYTVLEELQNGRMVITKYNGRLMRFDRPRVVVMANYLPKYDAVSRDRWYLLKAVAKKDAKDLADVKLVKLKTPDPKIGDADYHAWKTRDECEIIIEEISAESTMSSLIKINGK